MSPLKQIPTSLWARVGAQIPIGVLASISLSARHAQGPQLLLRASSSPEDAILAGLPAKIHFYFLIFRKSFWPASRFCCLPVWPIARPKSTARCRHRANGICETCRGCTTMECGWAGDGATIAIFFFCLFYILDFIAHFVLGTTLNSLRRGRGWAGDGAATAFFFLPLL